MLIVIAILLLALFIFLSLKKPGVALIASAIASILMAAAALEKSPGAMVIAPVIFLTTLIVVLMTRREPDSQQWPQMAAKYILIGIVVALFFMTSVVVFSVFGPSVLPFISFLILIIFIAFIGSLISYGLTSRLATAAYVISTIGSSMRQNLPLSMALESAASGRSDNRARTLQAIKKWLVQGYSLSESIKRGYPNCPGYAVAMITAAERIDQLPLAVKAIEADMVARADETKKIKPVHPFYPIILIVFMFFIVLGLMWKVLPEFYSILIEITDEAALPAPTRLLIRFTNFITDEYGWLIALALALIVLAAVAVSIIVRFRPRRPFRPHLLSRIGDFIKWHLPVLHWFEKNYSMVQVVELLRLSLNAGSTVNDAIANTLNLDVNNRFKKRLQRWLAKVEAGDNIAAAAGESRLGSCLVWAFDDQVNQGNTLAILETLESFYRSNYNYRVNLARFIMWPCVTLVMGVMVGFIVYAVYSPMVTFIDRFANFVIP
jgi:type IV pilus assembly protein PilC